MFGLLVSIIPAILCIKLLHYNYAFLPRMKWTKIRIRSLSSKSVCKRGADDKEVTVKISIRSLVHSATSYSM